MAVEGAEGVPNRGRGQWTMGGGSQVVRKGPVAHLIGLRRVGGILSACRTPTCSLLFSSLLFPLRNTGCRSPSPREPALVTYVLGRAHAHGKTRESRQPLWLRAPENTAGGGARQRAESATRSRLWAERCLNSAPTSHGSQAGFGASGAATLPEAGGGDTSSLPSVDMW